MQNQYTITNALITDGHSFLIQNGFIEIENGKILKIGKMENLPSSKTEKIDVKGRLVLPGITNFHHHLYSALATGLAPKGSTETFQKILENLWWHLDNVHDEESVYYSAIQGIIDSVRYGVTTIFDHHASMSHIKGSLTLIEKAFNEIGVKGVLCYEMSDRAGEKSIQEQLDENIEFYETHKKNLNLKGMLGLHANFTLCEKTMRLIRDKKPAEMPIHIHCGEAESDFQFCEFLGYAGPVDRLNQFNLLDSNSFLAHCIHMSKRDYQLINEINPVVLTNPESNANNNVGSMNTEKIHDYVLGTDGMTGNILGTMRSNFLLRNGNVKNPIKTLFQNPPKILNKFFNNVGELKAGYDADLAITNYIPVTDLNLENLYYHLMFGQKGERMHMTILKGKIVYKENKIQTINEELLIPEIKTAANILHRRFNE